MTNLAKKECKRMVSSFLRLKKNLTFFFAIYIQIYISIYLNISVYIYTYILKKRTRVGHAFFSKECNVLCSFAFFCKRMLHSLRSFMFFAKERCVLLRSLQKNIAFFVFFNVLKKRTQKNASCFWVS